MSKFKKEIKEVIGQIRNDIEEIKTVISANDTSANERVDEVVEQVDKLSELYIKKSILKKNLSLLNVEIYEDECEIVKATLCRITKVSDKTVDFDEYNLEIADCGENKSGYELNLVARYLPVSDFVHSLYRSEEQVELKKKDSDAIIKAIMNRDMEKVQEIYNDLFCCCPAECEDECECEE